MKELDNIKMWEFMAEKFNEDTEFGLVIRDALKNQGFEFKDNKIMPITTSSQKPKFKSGDWIVHQGTENIYQVLAIIDNQYQLRYGDTYTVQKCADVERCARLWDVAKDAKDGDVLLSPSTPEGDKECPFIFKEIDKNGIVRFHVALLQSENLEIADGITNVMGYANAGYHILANKEQRDLLFSKMKEAGYEWDAINKKLVTKTDDAESKDENMIKELLFYLDWLDGRKNYAPRGVYSIKEMLAWVKKQGNLVKYYEDKLDRCACDNFNKGYKKALEKQGEQKSFARYKVGDTIYYNSFGRLVSFVIANVVEDGTDNPMYEDKDGDSVFQNDIVRYECAMRRGEQKSAWSEEDENKLSSVLFLLHEYKNYNFDRWLKSLKDRVQPHPNQEWSEEDERLFQIVIDILDRENHLGNISHTDLIACVRKLKSLRPQSTWKPSEEQMKALAYAVFDTQSHSYHDRLSSLEQQLKKLK